MGPEYDHHDDRLAVLALAGAHRLKGLDGLVESVRDERLEVDLALHDEGDGEVVAAGLAGRGDKVRNGFVRKTRKERVVCTHAVAEGALEV